MNDFSHMNLPPKLMASLARVGFTTPTPIQAGAIPSALEGRDILGTAQTGTGKTAAFTIPLIAQLMNEPRSAALIMTPTRELATQVMQAIKDLVGHDPAIRGALLIGGEAMGRQMHQLHQNPRIIVGTPGRINDHLARGSVKLQNTDLLVLDETDRMLDMGFGVQIDKILAKMPAQRQTMLFSATLPGHILKLSARYLKNPVRVAMAAPSVAAENIKQETVKTTQGEKYNVLIKELTAREGSVIIFVKTKHGADRLADKLYRDNHEADAIHGNLRQNQRDKVIRSFREEKIRVLVATDVAARGLDVPHVRHVINYDLPQCAEDYIHRIGRTARAGAEGSSLSLLTPDDGAKWRAIERLQNPDAKNDRGEREEDGRRYDNKNRNGKKRRFGGGPGGEKFSGNFSKKKPHRKGPRPERKDTNRAA